MAGQEEQEEVENKPIRPREQARSQKIYEGKEGSNSIRGRATAYQLNCLEAVCLVLQIIGYLNAMFEVYGEYQYLK